MHNVRFGEPPVPGVAGLLEPVRDSQGLHRESIEMHNCLAAPHYASAVLAGRVYVYSLLRPQRCSVAIEPNRGLGGYRLRELRAACNQRPAASAEKVVEEWLRAASFSREGLERVRDEAPLHGGEGHDEDIPF